MRAYQFSAGPAMLPEAVLLRAQNELLDFRGSGVSIMELGHRTALFQEMLDGLEEKLRRLINIPNHYKVLFMAGGAQGHFSFIPMNLAGKNQTVDYFVTGIWSELASEFARKYANVHFVTSALANQIANEDTWSFSKDAAYVYYCPNETINGLQFHQVPEVNAPLVADMTSCILSSPIDVNQFGLIFASAQKNLGIAGITLLIIRDDLLDQAQALVPNLFHYKEQAQQHSLMNTVPTTAIYMMDLMVDWLIETHLNLGNVARMNHQKASKVYALIDESNGFYSNPIARNNRSTINIPFQLPEELKASFFEQAQKQGLTDLAGHRKVGGGRVSLYNAMPQAGVDKLIQFMSDFKEQW